MLRKNFKHLEKGGCDEAYIQLTSSEIEKLSEYPCEVQGVILGCSPEEK